MTNKFLNKKRTRDTMFHVPGAYLKKSYEFGGGRSWFIFASGGRGGRVRDADALELLKDPAIVGRGDGLFGDDQTYEVMKRGALAGEGGDR